jgi:hypothetical protein
MCLISTSSLLYFSTLGIKTDMGSILNNLLHLTTHILPWIDGATRSAKEEIWGVGVCLAPFQDDGKLTNR